MRLPGPSTWKIGLSLLAAVVSAGASMSVLSGCPLKNCDASGFTLTTDPNHPDLAKPEAHVLLLPNSRFIGEDTWETSPITDPYIDFPGQRFYNIYPPSGFAGQFTSITTFISADLQPSPPDGGVGGNFTIASGNLAEISYVHTGADGNQDWFAVHNDSCAQYYIRVVVTRAPRDGGADAAVGEVDAALDAPSEASTEAGPDAAVDAALDAPSEASAEAGDAGAE